jgi:hypothetical protein
MPRLLDSQLKDIEELPHKFETVPFNLPNSLYVGQRIGCASSMRDGIRKLFTHIEAIEKELKDVPKEWSFYNTSEKMPENRKPVLVWLSKPHEWRMAYWNEGAPWQYEEYWSVDHFGRMNKDEITYWCPLPPGPTFPDR